MFSHQAKDTRVLVAEYQTSGVLPTPKLKYALNLLLIQFIYIQL